MIDNFQGDPALRLTNNGATLTYKGGQPVMDAGLENQAQISLLTRQGWAGNLLFADVAQQIGSDFEEKTSAAITLSGLALIENAAENALDSELFGTVTAEASNPTSSRTNVVIDVQPPGQDTATILLAKNGQNWINQAANPAHERV